MNQRIPKPGEIWRRNIEGVGMVGDMLVLRVTNLNADPSRHHEYPPTVHFYYSHFKGISERSMPLTTWNEKALFHSDPSQPQYPYPGSLWKHRKKGTIYFCIGLSSMERNLGFVHEVLVSYRDEQGNEWSKPVEEFMQSMEKHNDD